MGQSVVGMFDSTEDGWKGDRTHFAHLKLIRSKMSACLDLTSIYVMRDALLQKPSTLATCHVPELARRAYSGAVLC